MDNNMQDVIPPDGQRSIRNIPVPQRRRSRGTRGSQPEPVRREYEYEREYQNDSQPEIRQEHYQDPRREYNQEYNQENHYSDFSDHPHHRKSYKKNFLFIGLGLIALVVLVFVGLSIFDNATINITPKTAEANIDTKIPIVNIEEGGETGNLTYKVLELSKTASKNVPSDGSELVQAKASGIITIYNEYSEEPQKLIKNTRFETPEGLIYRIENSIEIPGYTEKDGKKIPGTTDVEVFADEPGEKYNISRTNFTIPGFKGQDPYEFFKAESKTELSGGFDGVRETVTEEKVESTKSELEREATELLAKDLEGQVTDKFVIVYNSDSFTFGSVKQETGSGETVNLSLNASVKAYVVNAVDLANYLATNELSEYNTGDNVYIANLGNMSISLLNKESSSEDEESEETKTNNDTILTVLGNAEFIWSIDENQLKEDLKGTKRSELGKVMQKFTGVSKAEAKISPFWKSTFPEKIEKIDVKINL